MQIPIQNALAGVGESAFLTRSGDDHDAGLLGYHRFIEATHHFYR